ncbi:MAG: DUF1937 family protein [Acidiferrobacterales bacterium]
MTREPYWYVATPYSKYPEGVTAAFTEACRATAALLKHGIRVYSPIAHTHPIAIHGGLDVKDLSIWLPADRPLMQAAVGMIVVKMKGWEESTGIAHEIEAFKKAGKPVLEMEWPPSTTGENNV